MVVAAVEELGEGAVQDVVRLVDAVPAHEVDGQVVGGPERRAQVGRGRRGQRGHARTSTPAGTTPPRRGRPSRALAGPPGPVIWAYSPDDRPLRPCSRIFVSRSITTVRAGMLMPSDRVSVANTTRNRFDGEAVLHRLSEGGDQAGVVRAQARLEPRRPRPVPEDAQLLVGEALGVLLAAPADLGPLLGGS